MTEPDGDTNQLAAYATRAFNVLHRLAYAHVDTQLVVQQVSANFLEITAVSPPIVGQPLSALFVEFVGADETLQQLLRQELPLLQVEHVNRERPDGTMAYLTFQATLLDPEQPAAGLMLLVEDTTAYGRLHQQLTQDRNELRLLQRQLSQANDDLHQLNQMKSLFLSMAAHDLRTPLTAVYGYTNLLLSKPDLPTDRRSHFLEIIRAQSERLSRLVNDILNLDQIERKTLNLKPTACWLQDSIREVIGTLTVQIDASQQTIHTHAPDAEMFVWAEPEKLLQILYNLLGNAVKYTPAGGEITITVQPAGQMARIAIQDTGPGMTPAEVEQLFSLYYRTEGARKSAITGTGLGLFIVKMLVEAHQGTITVVSQPEQGSTFIVTLPLAISAG